MVKKYRKKPVMIEAVLWDGTKESETEIRYFSDNKALPTFIGDNIPSYVIIETLEGEMRASVGDYIIKGVQGEVYPCKPDIFEQTYELQSEV